MAAVQECLLQPSLTLPAITILRAHALAAMSSLVEAALDPRQPQQPSPELACALAAVLRLVPLADRFVGGVSGVC